MIKPRNSLVVVRLIEKAETRVGKIVIPNNSELYCEAEVLAVGPGSVSATGGRVETFDLQVGQRVFLQHKKITHLGGGNISKNDAGIVYRDGDDKVMLVEQMSILGIIAEPVEESDPRDRTNLNGN